MVRVGPTYQARAATPMMVAEGSVVLAKVAIASGRTPYRLPGVAEAAVLRLAETNWVKKMRIIVRKEHARYVSERRTAAAMAGKALKPCADELLWKFRRKIGTTYAAGKAFVCADEGQEHTTEREELAQSWPDLAWDLFICQAKKTLEPWQAWGFQKTAMLTPCAAPLRRAELLKLLGGYTGPDGRVAIGRGVGTVVNGEQFQRAVACLGLLVGEEHYGTAAMIVADLVRGNCIPWPAAANRGGYLGVQRAFARCDAEMVRASVEAYQASSHTPNLWAWQGKQWDEDIPWSDGD